MRYEKTLSNIQEVKARERHRGRGRLREDDEEVRKSADHVIAIPVDERVAAADSRDRAAAVAGVSHRGAARLRRGSAAQSGQERHGRMKQSTQPPGGSDHAGKGLYEFTRRGGRAGCAKRGVKTGLLTVFIQHTSASLTIQENADPDVIHDLNDFFSRIAPEDNRLYRHTVEGPDDMPAHIRAALTQTQLSDPGDRTAAWRWERGRGSMSSSIASSAASPVGRPAPARRVTIGHELPARVS